MRTAYPGAGVMSSVSVRISELVGHMVVWVRMPMHRFLLGPNRLIECLSVVPDVKLELYRSVLSI